MSDNSNETKVHSSKDQAPIFLYVVVCAIVACSAIAVYRGAARYPFIHQDYDLISKNNDIMELSKSSLRGMFIQRDYINFLPLRMISYAVDFRISGREPRSYHVTNVVLHTANSMLMFLVVLYLLSVVAPEPLRGGAAALGAGAAALFFALHPIQTESVTWVTGRKELLYSFFLLAGFYFFMRYRVKGDATKFRGGFILALLFEVAALLSKSTAAAFPAAVIIFDLVFPRVARRTSFNQRAQEYVFFFVPVILLLGLNIELATSARISDMELRGGAAINALTAVKIIPFYLKQVIWPSTLSVIYPVPVSRSVFDPYVLISVITLAAVVCIVAMSFRRRPVVSFGVLWFLLLVAPPLFLIRFGVFAADRYMYLPIAGVCVIAGMAYGGAARRGGAVFAAATFILAVAVAACVTTTRDRNREWSDPIAFWKSTVATAPGEMESHVGLGMAYLRQSMPEESLAELEKGLELGPTLGLPYLSLGEYFLVVREYKKAKKTLAGGLEYAPSNIEMVYYLAIACFNLGDYKAAVSLFASVAAAKPNYRSAREHLTNSMKYLSETMPFEEYQRFIQSL